jgi:hypothetical protein
MCADVANTLLNFSAAQASQGAQRAVEEHRNESLKQGGQVAVMLGSAIQEAMERSKNGGDNRRLGSEDSQPIEG